MIPRLATDREGVDKQAKTTTPALNAHYGLDFESIRKIFFIVAASFLSFDSGMSAGKRASTDGTKWYMHADQGARFGHGLHASHASLDERRANSLALIITTSLLFVLFASALMVGGHAIISPLLRGAPASSGNNRRGDIVYTMPDGMFCQHMTFDNSTGRIAAGGMDRCDPSIGSGNADRGAFRWGAH